jgi:selT/selW/selH-like putative selenoprotein
LKQEFGVEAELIRGTNGVFDVVVDDQLVFSKHESGRFPNDGEVEARVRRLTSSA